MRDGILLSCDDGFDKGVEECLEDGSCFGVDDSFVDSVGNRE